MHEVCRRVPSDGRLLLRRGQSCAGAEAHRGGQVEEEVGREERVRVRERARMKEIKTAEVPTGHGPLRLDDVQVCRGFRAVWRSEGT